MEKNCVGEKRLILSEEESLELKYYVLKETKFYSDGNKNLISYGIEIESLYNGSFDSKVLRDITFNKDEINSIVNVLMKNDVTAVHLNDVVEEMIN